MQESMQDLVNYLLRRISICLPCSYFFYTFVYFLCPNVCSKNSVLQFLPYFWAATRSGTTLHLRKHYKKVAYCKHVMYFHFQLFGSAALFLTSNVMFI